MQLSLITAPTLDWIEVPDARAFLRDPSDAQDPVIVGFVKAAAQHVQRITGRQLLTAIWELWLDAFPCNVIHLPMAPLASVTSIKYLDTAGVERTWATDQYRVSAPSGPHANRGRITPAYNVSYPSTYEVMDAVKIRFTAGYGEPKDVPPAMVEAMQLLVALWYENREAIMSGVGMVTAPIPYGVSALLAPFKLRPIRLAA